MVAMTFSIWDSHPRLKSANWLLGCMAAIAAVGAFVVSNRIETLENQQSEERDRAEELRRQASDEKIAELDAARARSDKDAAEARLKLKAIEDERTGLLTQEQWNQIAAAKETSRLGGGIGACSKNPNALELTRQLTGALQQANWAMMESGFDIPIWGVVVLVNSTHAENSKEHGKRLFKVLKNAGVDVELHWNEKTPWNIPFWVLVGNPRPPGVKSSQDAAIDELPTDEQPPATAE